MMPIGIDIAVTLAMKMMMLVGLGIYIVFAAVIVRQERLMAQVLESASVSLLSFFAWFHLAAAVFVFFLALLIL